MSDVPLQRLHELANLPPLPDWLDEPLMASWLSPLEALELWEAYLQSHQELTPLSSRLWPVAQKLYLWEAEFPDKALLH